MGNTVEEKLCLARHEVIKARLDGMDKALELKTDEMNRRLEGLNELREAVEKDRGQFVKTDTFEVRARQWDDVARRVTIIETRSIVWTAAIAIFFIIIEAVMYFLKAGSPP